MRPKRKALPKPAKRAKKRELDSTGEHPEGRKKEEMERAQVWSIDVLLALVIFVAVILIFYTTLNARQNPGLKELQMEASALKIALEKNTRIGFISSDKIDSTKLQNFSQRVGEDYSGVKEELGIRGDFCIFYEDEEGNLIPVDGKAGIGNSTDKLLINGKRCGYLLI